MEYKVPGPEGGARGALYSRMHVRTMQHLIYIKPERDWLVDPYVATHPRNKLNNRSNGKEVLLKNYGKDKAFGNEREARRFLCESAVE